MTPKRILVTGAGGFVGHALERGFAKLGWAVTAIDRSFDESGKDDGVRRVTADLAEAVPAELDEVDVVMHAAWVTTDPAELAITRAEYLALNLRPLLSVLEYASRTRPSAFVFLSSSGVFAAGDAADGLTDADRPTAASPYAVAKRASELLVPVALEPETAAHVVRLGYLYGPDEVARPSRRGVSLVAELLAVARAGEALSVRSDDPARDWTCTSDLARALERVVGAPAAGHPVHLGSPHVYTDQDLAGLIASHFPGVETVTLPSKGRVKPPMVPSDVAGLRGFEWTDLAKGLDALVAGEVAA